MNGGSIPNNWCWECKWTISKNQILLKKGGKFSVKVPKRRSKVRTLYFLYGRDGKLFYKSATLCSCVYTLLSHPPATHYLVLCSRSHLLETMSGIPHTPREQGKKSYGMFRSNPRRRRRLHFVEIGSTYFLCSKINSAQSAIFIWFTR